MRQLLRGLCEQALGFDNHFLGQYKEYVFTQLPQEKPFAVAETLQHCNLATN
ncbi:hypothetical protein [Fischerella thermalis]|uniref:hypothetical protein n=1 Tax=Fischerella thermalis TaxID=372787 RepID=UPI0015E0F321|nr:hypothetical protein [Fischerella thermalis]